MWDLRFSIETLRGIRIAASGEPVLSGEFSIKRHRSKCEWFQSSPERYQCVNGVFSEYPSWEKEQDDRQAEILAAKARVIEIEQAKETIGVHKLTVAQAENYINNQINNAATAPEKVEAVRNILLKMVPYLLK